MATLTAEESRNHHAQKMGEALGTQFSALWQEVAYLHMKWEEFVELFGSKETRIELLNQTAPTFFRVVQDVLWEETLLHIARLTDPPKRANKAVLTIKNLPKLVNDPATKNTVTALVKTAENKTEFCRDWRNRHIAHRNLNLALNKPARPLKDASKKQVDEALDSIVDVLNALSRHYTDSDLRFRMGSRAGGAVSLLYVLDDGLRAAATREERLRQGRISDEDYPRDL